MNRCDACNKLLGQPSSAPKHGALVQSAQVSNAVTKKIDANYFDCTECERRLVQMHGGNWGAYEDYANP